MREQLEDGRRHPLPSGEPPHAAAARLAGVDVDDMARATRPLPAPVRPKAFGDQVAISYDDAEIEGDPFTEWEGRLSLTDGAAGAEDHVAIRFPSRLLAQSPPFRIADVVLGLDDLHGATTWPVELWLESPSAPMSPRGGSVMSAGSLDAVAAGLVPRPPDAWRPTTFMRLPVGIALDVPDTWLSDAGFDDAFDRTDGPLDDGLSDWLECQGVACGLGRPMPPQVDLVAGQAVRTATGAPLLVVKFESPQAYAIRPALDLDLTARVTVDDSAAGFRRAGLAMRVMAADAYYRIEWVKASASVEVAVVTPGGTTVLGTFPAPGPPGPRVLQARVTGGAPAVRIAVSVDGSPVGQTADGVARLTGTLVGLVASDGAGTGERWDALVVERRPDVFTTVQIPPGEDVGLPVDLSEHSVISDSVLVSSDGSAFVPVRSIGPGCVNPGNPHVQLVVEETDAAGGHLFDREARLVAVDLQCASCPGRHRDCPYDSSLVTDEDTFIVGRPILVTTHWWNEHVLDTDVLLVAEAWSGPCSETGTRLVSLEARQVSVPPQAFGDAFLETAVLGSFAPLAPGPHCVVVSAYTDANGDCCPDGAESTPLASCAGVCIPAPASDSNPSTVSVYRDLLVNVACGPLATDSGRDGPDDLDLDGDLDEINLDGASLRVAKGTGNEITLEWQRVDPIVFPSRYNVHSILGARFDRSSCARDFMPVVDRPIGVTSRTYDVDLEPGEVQWFSVSEQDGCASAQSVADSSADDPALPAGCR